MSNPNGRPKTYTVEAMSTKIDEYFIQRDKTEKPYTVLSMCLYLNICRDTLLEYQKLREYSDTILRAKSMIEGYAEECLFTVKNPTGIMFNLKNNWGYKDKQEIVTTINETKLTEAQIDAKLKELE